jgi:hypothetical protein
VIAPHPTNERLQFLLRVVTREKEHLQQTDGRLFDRHEINVSFVEKLADDPDLSERVEAFVSRFSRLQDTLGDKLLPAVLSLARETPRTHIDNLDRAEKLGWLESADDWVALRKLRNQMIHEYMEDPAVMADALLSAHAAVHVLTDFALALKTEAERLLKAR